MKEEKKMLDAHAIIDKIIASTFTRYSHLSSEEFLKELGIETDNAKKEIILSKWKMIKAITKKMLEINDKFDYLSGYFNLIFNKGENNGK